MLQEFLSRDIQLNDSLHGLVDSAIPMNGREVFICRGKLGVHIAHWQATGQCLAGYRSLWDG